MNSVGISRLHATEIQKAYECWKLYESTTEATKVIRTGFWKSGIYEKPTEDSWQLINRGESDAEHEHATAILADSIYRWFPEIAPSKDFYREVLYGALTHDTGEIKLGDQADDGSRDEAQKLATELEEMEKIASHIPIEDQNYFLYTYKCFEARDDTNFHGIGIFLALCDKFESLLRMARYERDGYIGYAGAVEGCSKRDAYFAEHIGTYVALDVWSCAMFTRFRNPSPDQKNPIHAIADRIFRIFLLVLTVAVIDIRGNPFNWANDIYDQYAIPIEDIIFFIQRIKEPS